MTSSLDLLRLIVSVGLGIASLYTTVIFFLWRSISNKADKEEVDQRIEEILQRYATKDQTSSLRKDIGRHDENFKLLFEKIASIEKNITEIKTQLSFLDGKKLLQDLEQLKVLIQRNGFGKK